MTSLRLDPTQRIYVNRSLNFASIESIGFDMDHTLAKYNREEFEALAFKKTLEKFIDSGYPSELEKLKFDPHLVIRGLLVDREKGNLLKVDTHKYVKIATHGKVKIDKELRYLLYNKPGIKPDEFLSIDTFFALSEVQLFIEIVDFMSNNPGRIEKSFLEVYKDLRKFIDLSHADGSIKNEVIANIDRYIIKDKRTSEMLLRNKEAGKQLFLLTNSAWEYTNAVMTYMLDGVHPDYPNWQKYFDYSIVSARKPDFFTRNNNFEIVNQSTGSLSPHQGSLTPGNIYSGGNCNLFQKLTKQDGDNILYCGDHIYGDIIRSKEEFNWRTLLIVEELFDHLRMSEKDITDWDNIKDKVKSKEKSDEDIQRCRSLINVESKKLKSALEINDSKRANSIQKNLDKLKTRLSNLQSEFHKTSQDLSIEIKRRESHHHPLWGDLMRSGLEKSRFAKQILEYACIYTSDISNLNYYSPQKTFISHHDLMPHDV